MVNARLCNSTWVVCIDLIHHGKTDMCPTEVQLCTFSLITSIFKLPNFNNIFTGTLLTQYFRPIQPFNARQVVFRPLTASKFKKK